MMPEEFYLTVKDECWNVWEFAQAYSDHILAAYRVSPKEGRKCPEGLTAEEVWEAWREDLDQCGQEQKELRDEIARLRGLGGNAEKGK